MRKADAQAGNPTDREREISSDKDDAGRDASALPGNSMKQSGRQRVGDGYHEHYPLYVASLGKSALMGIKHHLLRLARIGANEHNEHHAAVTEADVRDLHGYRHAVHHDNLVAPVELVSFARRKRQRHIGIRHLACMLLGPRPGIATNSIIAAFISQRLQLLENAAQRQPLARRALGVQGQQSIELSLPASKLWTRLNLTLVGKRRLARAKNLAHRVSECQCKGMVLLAHIRARFRLSRETYGSPRMHADLLEDGIIAGRHRIARLMRDNDLKARQKRRFKRTTDSGHGVPVAPNHLDQDFAATGQDQKWAADISYIWTAEGWLFLAIVLDLYSRRIVGWTVRDRLRKDLALSALQRALVLRQPRAGILHHSDRGSHYCSNDYQRMLDRHGFIPSMSGTGNCYDNAMVETLFKTIKSELIWRTRFHSRG